MAGLISKETINLVHDTVDIVSVIGEVTKLERRSGNDWWGCCPFHGEKTPSFHVDGDKRFYYCFGCHEKGDVIHFLMEMEKISYVEAVTNLAKRAGIAIKYEDGANPELFKKDNKSEQFIDLYDRAASMFHYLMMETEQGKKALEYIKSRGLDDDTIKKFKLGYAPENRHWLHGFLKSKNYSDEFLKESGLFSKNYPNVTLFSDRLMFPIFNRNGKVVAFSGRVLHQQRENEGKYLNSPELPHYKKRETLFCFNFAKNSIRAHKTAIICEGNMDCIAYHQCGIDYAVAPLGTAFTDEQVKMLQGFADTILLSFDSDAAGQNATKKAISMCRKHDLTVKIIQLKGGKDPAEILLKYGKENLTMQVNNAILDCDYLLNILGEKYPTDIPEGKSKAALEFFDYVDSLQSDIQKESSLDLLSQTYNLKPEAVRIDYKNRNQAKERLSSRSIPNQKVETKPINLNAELRGLIAVTIDSEQFKILRSSLSEEDFKNPSAKSLYQILDACFQRGTYSIPDILNECSDQAMSDLISKEISSNVYQKDNIDIIVQDTIKYIKKRNIEDRRNEIVKLMRNYKVVSEQDQIELDKLVAEKMELDTQVQILKN